MIGLVWVPNTRVRIVGNWGFNPQLFFDPSIKLSFCTLGLAIAILTGGNTPPHFPPLDASDVLPLDPSPVNISQFSHRLTPLREMVVLPLREMVVLANQGPLLIRIRYG